MGQCEDRFEEGAAGLVGDAGGEAVVKVDHRLEGEVFPGVGVDDESGLSDHRNGGRPLSVRSDAQLNDRDGRKPDVDARKAPHFRYEQAAGRQIPPPARRLNCGTISANLEAARRGGAPP